MTLRWLCALIVPMALMGCKNDEQCWIDYTAEVSFCNADYLDCWSSAATPYDINACYHDTQATCLDEARGVLSECAKDDGCLQSYIICDESCETWDTACRRVCEKVLLECSSDGTCAWLAEDEDALFAADDDDSAGDDDDSAGDDDDAAVDDPLAGPGAWDCTSESWYNPSCEAACNDAANACFEMAGSSDGSYAEGLDECEEGRRACTMCCYGVEYHDVYTCDVFGL